MRETLMRPITLNFTTLSPRETHLIWYARVDNIPSSNTSTRETLHNPLNQPSHNLVPTNSVPYFRFTIPPLPAIL